MDALAITFDIDWACDEVIDFVKQQLNASGVKATFFATHATATLDHLDEDRFEIGLHPNYKSIGPEAENILAELKQQYPTAIGARSHGLVVSSNILQSYVKHGLRYESNIFLYQHDGLHPVWRFKSLLSIPFSWSDDKHLELGRVHDMAELRLSSIGLKVLNFHPIHVYLNSPDPKVYEEAKKDYKNFEWLESLRHHQGAGVGTLFVDLLRWVRETGTPTFLMRDFHKLYGDANG